MNRVDSINKLEKEVWDLAIIGGGASGLGVALDALSRGLSVLLVEKSDFAKGTSSRSTKLLHGGVRYLAQGDIGLVMEALKERGIIMKNAPHVSQRQSFVIPIYSFFDKLKYGAGLKIYDLMAGNFKMGWSQIISKEETLQKLPAINANGLKGGVLYYDGQFDDARLALNLAQTCGEMGGTILNYMKVSALTKDEKGNVNGLSLKDMITKQNYEIKAKSIVNATGVFADKVLKMDNLKAKKTLRPSQGAHIVLDISFLGGKDALMIPKTSDGRVLFGIPWHGKLIVGTTDTIRKNPKNEPAPLAREIDFILETCGEYMVKKPRKEDILSIFAGMRPLAAPAEEGAETKEISRSHKVTISDSNLVSIIGGKWTTFRKMGEDTVDAIEKLQGLNLQNSRSSEIKIHGFRNNTIEDHFSIYGSDADNIKQIILEQPDLGETLHPKYPYTKAEVVWMVRGEMALKVEDVLARRFRILFLDARSATEIAPIVAEIMAEEMNMDKEWIANETANFIQLAQKYILQLAPKIQEK
ncbi:MAG TPA: glycerol-3-phosphate dehydrogenase/oxidase [Anditalea sp.]|nr:glycerol-3-phosphate dehydrogenase/oxidase [Anditalea sp.]